ncbi:MAG: hypothetical protein A2104_00005 [Candidatus Melainabacteria bacterium GWF2_32_7]|nr:MAG: hypothetical protein A2104_00005 [Candidatus Melainabacteria bacterium GWF2_32_7]
MKVYNLYPQYRVQQERRQYSVPVEDERRSGEDRRTSERIKLDTNLTKDIFVVRNSISKLQNAEKNYSDQMLTKTIDNVPFARKFLTVIKAFNDQEINKELNNNLKKDNKSLSTATTAAGALTGVLAAFMGSLLLGPAAAIAGLGVGFYFGSKLFKYAISSHIKND